MLNSDILLLRLPHTILGAALEELELDLPLAFLPKELLYVLSIAALFFLLQILLCTVFYFRMKRHQRVLKRLLAAMERGENGRDVEKFAGRLPWLKWVDSNFPRNTATPANITRDDVLKELDVHIGSDGYYLLLQRLGVMAPLLGVVLTVAGFAVVDIGSESQSLKDILKAVTPLVAGVGTGAILAFINQWLLHFVGNKVEAVRNEARAWFDAAIWRNVGLDTQAATVKAITAIERMAKAVTHAAEQQEATAKRLDASAATIHHASKGFQQVYAAFGTTLQGLPGTLQQLTSGLQATLETLQTLLPLGQKTVASLDVSVSTFRAAVENEFVTSAKTHQLAIDAFAESSARINEATARLQVSSGDLQETVNAHTNAFKLLNRSLQKQVLPAHEGFLAAMTQFNGRAEGLIERVDSLHGQLIESLEKLAALQPDAASAIALFTVCGRDLAETIQHRFTPATEQHRHQLEALGTALHDLQTVTVGLAEGGKAVEGAIKNQNKLSEDLGAVQGSLKQSVETLAEASGALRQSVESDVLPAQQAMHQVVGGFQDSSRQLSSFIDRGLEPVTQRLTQLDEVLTRFAGTVDVIRDFTEVRKDIEHLSRSLAQAATVAEAITALPNQMREVLEQLVSTHQAQLANESRGGFLGLFGGRKRG